MNSNAKKILKVALLSIFFIFIAVYAFSRSYDLIFGVEIKNVNITDGARVTESITEVTGNAKGAVKLTLNGREISLDQSGYFTEKIALLSGYNIINLRAEDKFGYIDEKNYQLIYEKQI